MESPIIIREGDVFPFGPDTELNSKRMAIADLAAGMVLVDVYQCPHGVVRSVRGDGTSIAVSYVRIPRSGVGGRLEELRDDPTSSVYVAVGRKARQ